MRPTHLLPTDPGDSGNSGSPTTGRILRLALARDGRATRLALCTGGLIVHDIGEAAVPVLIGTVIDRAIMPGNRTALVVWLGVLAATFLVMSLSYQRSMLGMVRVYGLGEHDLRQLSVGRVLHPRRHAHRSTGELLSIATNDTYQVAGVSWSIVQQLATVAGLLTAAGALLVISVPLGVGVLLGAVAVLSLMQRLSRPMFARGRTEQRAVAAASDVAADAMAGLRIISGLGAQDEVSRRYRAASRHSRDTAVASAVSLRTYDAVSEIVSLVYLAVLTVAAGWMAVGGTITPGELVTVIGLAQFLKGTLAHIGTFGANWSYKRASAARLRALVADPFLLPTGLSPGTVHGEVAGGATLTWTSPDGARLTASPGRLVGVRVRDAAAARHLVDRLGFRTAPRRGELALGGDDALDIGPDRWRRTVTVPPRDSTLFSGTLRHNVTFEVPPDGPSGAAPAAPLDPSVTAATALDDVIDHLGSVDAPVGEGGHRLSGGQRQRVTLARALHTAGPVLVLDEPTTSLDPVTAREVAAGLARLTTSYGPSPGRAVVVVTTDHALLELCDEVVEP
ncbi:ABC transporter transmembrane domain-containing protein [Corynebacterium sp.]|uniref:ABC transporter transmembrane domain-containing protein n=1 Tax=Corynebacterium sp. TaxID=1720 RepID=UPI003B3A9FA6